MSLNNTSAVWEDRPYLATQSRAIRRVSQLHQSVPDVHDRRQEAEEFCSLFWGRTFFYNYFIVTLERRFVLQSLDLFLKWLCVFVCVFFPLVCLLLLFCK